METVSTLGIDPETGQLEEHTEGELFELIKAQAAQERGLAQVGQTKKTLGPPQKLVDFIRSLSKVGWGVIFPAAAGAKPEQLQQETLMRQALENLLNTRKQQAGALFKTFEYRQGMSVDEFLYEENREVERGAMNVAEVPYYLLIVASPERIPWDFQTDLDGEYAVGRLWFDDPADCTSYVTHLLKYEAAAHIPVTARETLLVGVRHVGDRATLSSASELVRPVMDYLVSEEAATGYSASLLMGGENDELATTLGDLLPRLNGQATLANVLKRLGGLDLDGTPRPRPAILFTASHGLEYRSPHDNQPNIQGAPVFQEWDFEAPVKNTDYLGATQAAGLDMQGMMVFSFACFSAGTPLTQDWVHPSKGTAKQIAKAPFVARTPQKYLGRGALAFIGHVSKTWGYSYHGISADNKPRVENITDLFYALIANKPVGHATDSINLRRLHLNTILLPMLENPDAADPKKLVNTWIARNDFQGYVVLGDPFASLK